MSKAKKDNQKAITEHAKTAEKNIKKIDNTLLKFGAKNPINHGYKSQGGVCDTVATICGIKDKPITMDDLIKEAVSQGHTTITGSRVRGHYDHIIGEHNDFYSVKPNDKGKGFLVVKGKQFEKMVSFNKMIK